MDNLAATPQRLELYRLEIERLKSLLYRADAVVFDRCSIGARGVPRLEAKESKATLDAWAVMSIDRYVSVNPGLQTQIDRKE